MASTHDPDGRRLPIKLDSTSNGEYAPIPLEPVHREARHEAMEAATANARRLGLKRREFLVSACGAATALLGMNTALRAGPAAPAAITTSRNSRRSRTPSRARPSTATSSSSTCRATS